MNPMFKNPENQHEKAVAKWASGVYTSTMTTKRKNRSPQTPKPAAMRTGSLDTRAMLLRTGEGPHKNPKAYVRKPKHFKGYDSE